MRASMGDIGACWDNAVVERYFGSLKHDWIFKQHQPTREHMENDVAAFMKYYNLERLLTKCGLVSLIVLTHIRALVSAKRFNIQSRERMSTINKAASSIAPPNIDLKIKLLISLPKSTK